MQVFLPILKSCPLFDGIDPADLPGMLDCLGARVTAAKKNQVVIAEGDPATHVGIMLIGSVQIVKEDFYGNRSIVGRAESGELFGESFACADIGALPVSVVAEQDSQIMLINSSRITASCSNACVFHRKIIFNLLRIVASKNLAFHQKLEITAKRTTREKLMSYLMAQAKQRGSNRFTIPFDRQALADYLAVDRSAMSAELSKLRREGILKCEKSHFELL